MAFVLICVFVVVTFNVLSVQRTRGVCLATSEGIGGGGNDYY